MALRRHAHPASCASIFGAALGIVLLSLAILGIAPIILGWPASWPGIIVLLAMVASGIRLLLVHRRDHRNV